ncbi:GreA/GreB family elongation factor, partial [Patescibacteria group bacterium]|nr:GreA/GreB family elongation factor [Patescibacteria group bacterium]
MKQSNQITLNLPFKIKFADGQLMNIVITDPNLKLTHPDLPTNHSCFYCSLESPLGKTLLGHQIGEKVDYLVGN